MKKNILAFSASFVISLSTVFSPSSAKAQSKLDHETIERIVSFWSLSLEQVRVELQASKAEFDAFQNFYRSDINSLQHNFMSDMLNGKITMLNVKDYVNTQDKPTFRSLYKKFQDAELNHPTSVDEYRTTRRPRIGGDSCFPTCYNTDFANGYLDGWYGYYAEDQSTATAFNITNITGGYIGHFTQGALDPLTGYPNDYQIHVTSGGLTDAYLNTHSISMSQVSPWASGGHSVMLGDSTLVLQGAAILSQSFQVTTNTANLNYQFALLLENPASHTYYEQPFFTVAVLDQNGDTIPVCGQYHQSAFFGSESGYYPVVNSPGDTTFWKDWSVVNVPLKAYIGQCVTLVFEIWDCALGGHYGYAYVNASCSPLGLISSSNAFCGQDSISLTAPPGGTSYAWSGGPTHGIISDTTRQIVWVDSAGTYKVIVVPVTGALCADTISITVGKIPGPPPHPKFTADTVCAGQPMHFINTSDSTKGKFSWDFYNIGIYNYSDTNNFNPTWTYLTPGVYTVKLHELLTNGCGNDTLIKVYVDTNVTNPTFTASPTCFGDTTYFTASAPGASKYDWNFGDPTTGIHDSSKLVGPGHKFSAPGNYTVTFTGTNLANCGATEQQVITIYAMPTPRITGKDTICPGTHDTLYASGGTTYLWNNLYNTTSLPTAPTTTKTFTLQAFNGTCEKDTTFTIVVVPAPTPVIVSSKDTGCKGDTLTLWASGGSTYKWGNGNTTSTIHVTLDSTTTYKIYEFGGTCEDSTTYKVILRPTITATKAQQYDSICPGTPDILSVVGAGGQATYLWSTGETTSIITVSPTVNTTYTAAVMGACNTINESITVSVDPLPSPVITGPTWECVGVSANLSVSSSSNPTTYLWSNGKTTTSISTGPITKDTTFKVIAKNKLGCIDSTTYTVDLRKPATILMSKPTLACGGQDVLLSGIATGTGPFTYTWSPGGATTDTVTVNPSSKTTYTLTVSNGCKSTAQTTVTPDSPPLTACCNKAIIIGDDTIITAHSSATGVTAYTWIPSVECLNPPLCDSVKVTPTVTTTYTVTITDSLGCQVSKVVTIEVEIPCFNFTVPNVITPDEPGPLALNNLFYIKTTNLDAWSLVIFDRWGKEMYKSANPNEFWAGTTEGGSKASDGVYYYLITATCQGTNYKKEGFVQLIR